MLWWYLAALAAANLALWLPQTSPLQVTGAFLLIGFLPGLGWTVRLLPNTGWLFRLTVAVALSYLFTSLTALLLHYLPGPIQIWLLLLSLNVLALLPLLPRTKIALIAHCRHQRIRLVCVGAAGGQSDPGRVQLYGTYRSC